MSYIRCTSNPEKLYVWSDFDGNIYFAKKAKMLPIPQPEYNAFIKAYKRPPNLEEIPFIHGNITLKYTKKFKVSLKHSTWKRAIIMWPVTWNQITRHRG